MTIFSLDCCGGGFIIGCWPSPIGIEGGAVSWLGKGDSSNAAEKGLQVLGMTE